jgi:nicotinamidase-related amidase
LNFFKSNKNIHGQSAWIWNKHCIEDAPGHKIAKELQEKLSEFSNIPDKIVRYHIKGQNNLAEMYSIFSAESPVSDEDATKLKKYVYTGDKTENLKEGGADSYEKAMNSLNLDTSPNTKFVNYLLDKENKVYICGEAKTHCVKSSLIDLNELVDEAKRKNICLLANMTSPIIGPPDDIVAVSKKYGNNVIEVDTYTIV